MNRTSIPLPTIISFLHCYIIYFFLYSPPHANASQVVLKPCATSRGHAFEVCVSIVLSADALLLPTLICCKITMAVRLLMTDDFSTVTSQPALMLLRQLHAHVMSLEGARRATAPDDRLHRVLKTAISHDSRFTLHKDFTSQYLFYYSYKSYTSLKHHPAFPSPSTAS